MLSQMMVSDRLQGSTVSTQGTQYGLVIINNSVITTRKGDKRQLAIYKLSHLNEQLHLVSVDTIKGKL